MLPARRGGSSREALQHERVPRPHRAVRQELMAGERIVFVDDEEQIRKLLSTWLSRHGYEVTLANDGWEALKAIRAKMPDLVITDVSMPNMNGFELTRRLRADHRTARVPVLMLSARKEADDVLTGYSAGALSETKLYRVSVLDLNLEFANIHMQLDLKPTTTLAHIAQLETSQID